MPEPDFVTDPASLESPHTPTEILGRGQGSRKSKTFLENAEVAMILGKIRGHVQMLVETFRRTHAAHNTRSVVEKDSEGNEVQKEVPEVLSKEELRREYPIIRQWEEMHQEQVEHYASIEGFSVSAATTTHDRQARGQHDETSAGSDQPDNQPKNDRWA